MKKIIGILLIVILVGSFLGTGYYLFSKSQEAPIVYQTDSLFVTTIVKKTVATGAIIPRKEIALKSQVSGVVETLYVIPGDKIKEGDMIAKIKIIPDVVTLNNAENRIKTATINLKNAEREFERNKNLFDQKVIAERDFLQFKLNKDLAMQELEAAENNLDLIREGASKKSSTVSNIVRATTTGTVLDVPVKEGSFVIESNTFNDGTTIASVANMSDMIFEGEVDESEVGKIKEGMNLILNIGAIDTEKFNADLEYISPKGLEKDGAIKFQIRAAVKLQEGKFLRAGYSANADIVLDQKENVLSVKESNLIFEDDKIFVEVETGPQTFEKKEIKTGLSDGINIEILSGLKKEDKVKKAQQG